MLGNPAVVRAEPAAESGGGPSLGDRIAAELEADIIEGRLRAGTKLDEGRLAARFGVSRTPIREALRILAAHGVIEHRPRQGAVVGSPTVGQVMDLFETVAELEAAAIRLAVLRLSPERERLIVGAHERCAAAALSRDADAYFAMNAAFHGAIHESALNGVLLREIRALDRHLAPYRRFITFRPGRQARAVQEHEAILAAVCARDAEAAMQAMRSHVLVLGEDALALARSLRIT